MNQPLTPIQRLQAPTPKFFQLATKAGVVVAVIAGALAYASNAYTLFGQDIPFILVKATEVVAYVAAGIATISPFGIRSES